ncbi:MAG: PQQ-binding-like beta-propeller repeat protein [Bacteroidia bacterium]|nr:PQQ-binding-like beta-propeller repeat protein [Bacteroidia bacterium]
MKSHIILLAFLSFGALCGCRDESHPTGNPPEAYRNWSDYLGDPGRSHYSSLDQITPKNVNQLKVAWIHHSKDHYEHSKQQSNPIIIANTLYAVTPGLKVVALDAATGKEKWIFAPPSEKTWSSYSRGLTYWADGEDQRILFAAGHLLYALNAQTGQLIHSFGNAGKIDLKEGLGRDVSQLAYNLTSPGTVYKNLIIIGGMLAESLPAAPGHIRAFDVRSGKQAWIFHSIPQPGQYGYDTWPEDAYQYIGGVNNWCGMTLDNQRGIVFVPTGVGLLLIFGGATAKAKTSLPTACWPWMPTPANGAGISRPFTTISGIAIYPRPLPWYKFAEIMNGTTPWPRLPNRVMCSYLTGKPANHFIKLLKNLCPAQMFGVKKPGLLSPYPRVYLPLPVKALMRKTSTPTPKTKIRCWLFSGKPGVVSLNLPASRER